MSDVGSTLKRGPGSLDGAQPVVKRLRIPAPKVGAPVQPRPVGPVGPCGLGLGVVLDAPLTPGPLQPGLQPGPGGARPAPVVLPTGDSAIEGSWFTSDGDGRVVDKDQVRDENRIPVAGIRGIPGSPGKVLLKAGKKLHIIGQLVPEEGLAHLIQWEDGTCWTREVQPQQALVPRPVQQPLRVSPQALHLVAAKQAAANQVANAQATVASAFANNGPELQETYGYNLAVAKAQLCQYLQKRNMPTDIPVEKLNGANGPFRAWMEIKLSGGRGIVRQEYTVQGKKAEATNMLALKMVVELCRIGEMGPYRTKAQVLAEGLRPCPVMLQSGAVQQLEEFTRQMDMQLAGAGIALQPAPHSLQPDFDAAAWATLPDAREITWSPPRWGHSPWGGERATEAASQEEEAAACQHLADAQEQRNMSLEYAATWAQRATLPIAPLANDIVDSVEANPVVLISGSTGCGKTTQVPQFLLERATKRGEATRLNVVCTQPRRIAAMAAAERVAMERGEPLGQSVGYIVRFHQVLPRSYASVCFMTTGMLLRRMARMGLRGISHVIVDEVHERDLDTDFLITLVRELLRHSPGMRVILMSATIDLAKWGQYFGHNFGAPIEIPGRLFPVTTHYLEDAMRLTGVHLEPQQQRLEADIPMDLLEKLLEHLVGESAGGERGAILVFLPGWDAIAKVQSRLKKRPTLASRAQVHMLHSQVPREEQQAAFLPAPAPLVKVILSTNIAETSVTISDVFYVIDSCRVRQLVASQSIGCRTVYRLTNTMASKQNLTQRAGRAGRVREGVCYRLCTKSTYNRLQECLSPDMTRLPLHQVALTLKSLNLGHCASFLAQAPDPPPSSSVHRAVTALQDLKALDSAERITTLGLQLAKLPIEPRMGFALLAACMLGLGEPMAALCALTAAPSPYTNEQFRGRDASFTSAASRVLLSDHHDLLMTYYKFRQLSPDEARFHCMRFNLEVKVLSQVVEAVDQSLSILRSMGFNENSALAPCGGWISLLGTPSEEPEHRQCWAALTLLLGLGLEHFGVRQDDRRLWISEKKSSQVKATAAIPEAPPPTPATPFWIFGELQESEWSSSCRGATAASAVATLLGAARDMRYDSLRSVALLDGWAPVQLPRQIAMLLGKLKAALRICLLQLTHTPALLESDPLILAFGGLLALLCEPAMALSA